MEEDARVLEHETRLWCMNIFYVVLMVQVHLVSLQTLRSTVLLLTFCTMSAKVDQRVEASHATSWHKRLNVATLICRFLQNLTARNVPLPSRS